jgi:pimeloyl-ACP methyl ester carboxylesterase
MNTKLIPWIALIFVLAANTIHAQESPAANGKFATIKGLKLYYEESGTGTPFIILHGFNGSATLWKDFVAEYKKHYRVIVVDLPGHGRSDYMDTTRVYLHKRAAGYILGLADYLKLDSMYVMGASSGGFITMYMATLRPDAIRRIIVVGGQVYYSKQTRQIIEDCCGDPPGDAAITRHGKEKATLLRKQFYYFRKLYGDPSFTADVMATIKAKALIVHGDNDRIAPVSNAWEMYKSIPKAFLWVVPSGGHTPFEVAGNGPDFIVRTEQFLRGEWDWSLKGTW